MPTNTTLFNTADPNRVHEMFDTLMEMGVEGMMLSPGYPYEKAPDQEHFLHRNQTIRLFRRLFATAKKSWKFNQSPLFLDFLRGHRELECTPWGNPTYNVFGWQRPCYLLQEGYCETFQELLETTAWERYGRASGNAKCTDCMVHCGYEPTAVHETFNSWKGLLAAARATFFGMRRESDVLTEEPKPSAILPILGATGSGCRTNNGASVCESSPALVSLTEPRKFANGDSQHPDVASRAEAVEPVVASR